MNIRTTQTTYEATKTVNGEVYHNVDDLGRVTHTENDATKTAEQLRGLGYRSYIASVPVGIARYSIYTNPKLGEQS